MNIIILGLLFSLVHISPSFIRGKSRESIKVEKKHHLSQIREGEGVKVIYTMPKSNKWPSNENFKKKGAICRAY